MPGLCFSNELISRDGDEGMHCDFACLLYSKLINKLPTARITEIICSAVEIEMEFVVDALPVKLIGMNSSMMCDYIKFCANRLLYFVEKRVGEYFKSGVGVDRADQSFALDASF